MDDGANSRIHRRKLPPDCGRRSPSPAGSPVHGSYGKTCPDCDMPVQRIRYATNETNYCPQCQTRGKLLADRSMSRLLKKDWPGSLEQLEARRQSITQQLADKIREKK